MRVEWGKEEPSLRVDKCRGLMSFSASALPLEATNDTSA